MAEVLLFHATEIGFGEIIERGVRAADSLPSDRVYAGFSGWGPGQLEAELDEESWFVEAPIPPEIFPDDPATLWSDVLERKGGEYALVARMPDDPSLN